jgi:hypothetical protein
MHRYWRQSWRTRNLPASPLFLGGIFLTFIASCANILVPFVYNSPTERQFSTAKLLSVSIIAVDFINLEHTEMDQTSGNSSQLSGLTVDVGPASSSEPTETMGGCVAVDYFHKMLMIIMISLRVASK